MSPTHHLTDETLQDYAAGSLDVPMETLVACHLTLCSRCRSRSGAADAVGGSFLAQNTCAQVSASASDLLSRARSEQSDTGVKHFAVRDVPRPLGRLLPDHLDALDWKRVAPGIRQFNLTSRHRRDGAFKMLHLAPGTMLAEHGHNDRELTYVVRGSYTDEVGQFRVGDIADLDAHDNHRPIVDAGEPCIALIATQSPVKFTGLVGRIMQPFIGI